MVPVRALQMIFWLAFLLAGCNGVATKEQAFLRKFSQEDFNEFKNTSFFWRGRDEDSMMLVLAEPRLDSTCSPITFISVDVKTRRINRVRRTFELPCKSGLSKPQIERLATKVIGYSVRSVNVDDRGNVTIGFQPSNFTSDDLVKVVDKRSFSSSFWKEYAPVRDSWYVRKVDN